jgi:hypothetical protein
MGAGMVDPAVFEAFVQQFPNGKYAAIAKAKIAELKRSKAPEKFAVSSGLGPNDIVLDFNSANTVSAPGHLVSAAPLLKNAAIPISITDVDPAQSSVVLVNNLGLYDGRAVKPTYSENFLTQVNTGNVPASFVLKFDRPVQRVTFILPAVYPYTESGITFPAWKAAALSASGEELSSTSEKLLRQFKDYPAQSFTLNAPAFEGISAVKFSSDPNLGGKPFAAFSTLLIEQLILSPK